MICSPVIFLDFDGPLVHGRYLASQPRDVEHRSPQDADWSDRFDPACVVRVSRIAEATGAHVVVSSAWRQTLTVGGLWRHLRRRGFTGRVFDRTPVTGDRCEEIRAWLAAHAMVDRFVVIDDEPRAWGADALVLVDYAIGITDSDVERAIAILTRAE